MQLHHDVARFATVLKRLALLLTANGAGFWGNHVEACRRAVENSDVWGVRRFQDLCGGMGSLNDLVLQRDGSPLLYENDELHALLSEARVLASELAGRSHNAPLAAIGSTDPQHPTGSTINRPESYPTAQTCGRRRRRG
ncbi:DUF6966 domain-containing protein [Rhizobium laguerreae]|uniref:DUF6966 domain-containing protein n=1 Tax=Rhizobium laguerreae TaxID=1076926 RepID=UPI003D7C1D51